MLSSRWHITLLGGLRAEQDGKSVTRFRTRKTASLLATLAYHADRIHPRDELVELLWPDDDPDAARASLRTALNSLRKQLEPPGVPPGSVLVTDRSIVRLRKDAVSTDVAEFKAALREARAAADAGSAASHLTRAVQAYQGELLPGFYEDWVLSERQHLAESYTGALLQLIAHREAGGDITQALEYARLAISNDRTNEEAHQKVICLLRKAGRPADALQQYRELERILREQLDVQPSEESRALADSLRGTAPHRPARKRRRAQLAATVSAVSPSHRRETTKHAPSLPLPMMPFFGREEEMARIEEIFLKRVSIRNQTGRASGQGVRLLTLLGLGGTGKTRLAIETARRLQRAFNDSVWYVPLAGLSEPQSIPDTILDTMKLSRKTDGEWHAPVRALLEDRPGLLVLDNFEHLVEGGAVYVEELLARLPGLACLITSRVRLGIDGERLFEVQPLLTPSIGDTTPGALVEYASVRLFTDRAQAARADFQVTAGNAEAVAELCRRLEGLPLALELAASWAQTLTPHQMLERTRERLGILTSRRRGGEGRHQSLRAALEWSYSLLTPELQTLFRRLSVFRGGWNGAAAVDVCSDFGAETGANSDAEFAMLRDLTLLAEASLISTEEVALQSGPEMRFRMLETLREYGAELLSQEEQAELSNRHATHFGTLVEEYAEEVHQRFRDRLDHDLDNLRAALRWIADTPGEGEQALRLAVAMFPLWVYWDHMAEALEWTERVLLNALPGTALAAEALNKVGVIHNYLNHFETSLAYQQRHLEARRALGDELGIARALSNSGLPLVEMGRLAEARPLHEESVEILRRLGAEKYLPAALLNLADTLRYLGEHDRARELYWESIHGYERVGSPGNAALGYESLGKQARQLGDIETAREMLETAIKVCQGGGKPEPGRLMAEMAEIQEELGNQEEARRIRKEMKALQLTSNG
jgi:predicted ATPase/DNA-binding SARP family transcriptional activator